MPPISHKNCSDPHPALLSNLIALPGHRKRELTQFVFPPPEAEQNRNMQLGVFNLNLTNSKLTQNDCTHTHTHSTHSGLSSLLNSGQNRLTWLKQFLATDELSNLSFCWRRCRLFSDRTLQGKLIFTPSEVSETQQLIYLKTRRRKTRTTRKACLVKKNKKLLEQLFYTNRQTQISPSLADIKLSFKTELQIKKENTAPERISDLSACKGPPFIPQRKQVMR